MRKFLSPCIPLMVGSLGLGATYRLLAHVVPARDEQFIASFHKRGLQQFFPHRGEMWLDDVVQRLRHHHRWSYLDSLILPRLPMDIIDDICRVSGWEVIDRALDRGRGLILYGIHYGRIWTGIIYICKRGYRLSTIVRLRGLGAARNLESCLTGVLIDAEDFSKERVYERLRRNEIILTMADGGVARRPVETRFLGRTVRLSPSFIKFAQETGAALAWWIGVSRRPDCIALHFQEAPAYRGDDSFGRQMEILLRPLATYVRSDPSQWYSARRMLGL